MAVVSFTTRRILPSTIEIIDKLDEIVTKMENIPENDAVYKSTSKIGKGRLSSIALRHLNMLKNEYLNWRASAQHIHFDPRSEDIRQRFAAFHLEFLDALHFA